MSVLHKRIKPTEIEFDERITETESQLTDTQLALTEQFELNLLLDAQLTDTQLALTEIYENMGV